MPRWKSELGEYSAIPVPRQSHDQRVSYWLDDASRRVKRWAVTEETFGQTRRGRSVEDSRTADLLAEATKVVETVSSSNRSTLKHVAECDASCDHQLRRRLPHLLNVYGHCHRERVWTRRSDLSY